MQVCRLFYFKVEDIEVELEVRDFISLVFLFFREILPGRQQLPGSEKNLIIN